MRDCLGLLSLIILLSYCSISNAGGFTASIHGVVFGSAIEDVEKLYPRANKIRTNYKVEVNEREGLVVYGTKSGRVYKVRYRGDGVDCYAIMERLLDRFPSDDPALTSVEAVTSKDYLEWRAGGRYEIGFTSCGPERLNVHITDLTTKKEADAIAKSGDVERNLNFIKRAQESGL